MYIAYYEIKYIIRSINDQAVYYNIKKYQLGKMGKKIRNKRSALVV